MSTYRLDTPTQYFCKGCGENYARLTHWNEYTKAYKIVYHLCQCQEDRRKRNIEAASMAGREAGRRYWLRLLEIFKEQNTRKARPITSLAYTVIK